MSKENQRLAEMEQGNLPNVLQYFLESSKNDIPMSLVNLMAKMIFSTREYRDSVVKCFEELAEFDNYEIVAKAVYLIGMLCPWKSEKMLSEITTAVWDPTGYGKEVSPSFIMGAILGLFEFTGYLDMSYGRNTDFIEGFPGNLKLFLCSNEKVMEKVTNELITVKYSDRLGKAIKRYVTAEGCKDVIGHRYADIYRITELLKNTYDAKQQFFPLQELIIEQITQKHLAAISNEGRVRAINLLHHYFIH